MARPRPAPNLLGQRLEALRKAQEHAMRTSQKTQETITTIGIDLGKNTFHLVGLDKRGAIALQRKVSRSQLEHRLSNVPRCLIGMEACSGSHHIGRQLTALGHDVRLIPAQYVKPFLKGHKNDYRDAEAIAEAVQRPTMSFVAIKTPEQMDLLALHRVRSRLVGQRTGTINQIRGFLLERGIIVRQGVVPLRKALPDILSSNTNILSPRMVSLIADLMQDWRRLDERIETVSTEIEALALQDDSCQRLMTVPGVGPIISSAMVAAIGNGAGFKQGRDFSAWLGLVPKQESTGDRTILGKISKRGNKYVRTLFVQAAHVVLVRRPERQYEVCGPGSSKHRSGCIATCWRSRSPTNSHASPGRFSPEVKPTSRGLLQMPRDKGSLRSTKGIPATPLRHHRSPHWASERRWLRGDGFT
jgi:transposase